MLQVESLILYVLLSLSLKNAGLVIFVITKQKKRDYSQIKTNLYRRLPT